MLGGGRRREHLAARADQRPATRLKWDGTRSPRTRGNMVAPVIDVGPTQSSRYAIAASPRTEVKAVAQGNITGNVLRRIASLSGGSGPQRAMQNLIQGGAVGGGLGFALGGPAGAAIGAGVAPVAGQLAGRMATRGTQRRADYARALAARGQTPKQARKAPQDSTLTELMAGFLETSP